MSRSRVWTGLVLAVGGAAVVFLAFDRPFCLGSDCGPDLWVLVSGLLAMVGGGLLLARSETRRHDTTTD